MQRHGDGDEGQSAIWGTMSDVRDRERNVADTEVCDLGCGRRWRPSVADRAREKID